MSKHGTGSIFCDGACRGNGQRGAIGGWAWAYWPGVAHGEPLRFGAARLATSPSVVATNQRAELTALLEALRSWRTGPEGGGAVTIYTDSMYAMNCASIWGAGWKRKAWKRQSGEPLQNLDIIKPLVDVWQSGIPLWKLVHVRGHQTGATPEVHGNNWVDRAAVAGSLGQRVSPALDLSLSLPLPLPSPLPSLVNPTYVDSADTIEILHESEPEPNPEPKTENPKPNPKPNPEPKTENTNTKPKTKKSEPVKQLDIRSWFGQ